MQGTEILELGYVTLGVEDIDAFGRFATKVVGAEIGGQTADELLLRNDSATYRVRVLRDPVNDVLVLGWCVANKEVLDSLAQRLSAAGLAVSYGTADEAEQRRVRDFISFKDPDGLTIEVFHGLHITPERPFNSPLPIAGFVTGHEGMGHVGIWISDMERSLQFYRDTLGFHVCDRFDAATMKGAFLRCNDRQHSLALVERGAPYHPMRALHHVEFELKDMDDLGRAYDRAEQRNIVLSTLGKHSAEEALCFYMYTPAGFGWELSWGGVKVTTNERPETWHGEASLWGLRFLQPSDEQDFS